MSLNFENQQKNFIKSAKILFCFLFTNVYKENMFTIEKEDGRKAS